MCIVQGRFCWDCILEIHVCETRIRKAMYEKLNYLCWLGMEME